VKNKIKAAIWKWTLKTLRIALDRADDWLHAKEVALRDEAAKPALLAEVDPVASRAREKAIKRERKPRARKPRLVYQHGEFVRRES
jgi:hypothetical protein